ncbi:MAG: PAS domain-containing sensor histidine kinase [Sphingobacteriia bacterium]|jgi:signal transduction histidine kinase
MISLKKDHLIHALNNIGKAILFENNLREITFINQFFCDLFSIENSPKSLIGTSSIFLDKLLENMVIDKSAIKGNLSQINDTSYISASDQILLNNGKVLIREYFPMIENGQLAGKLWLYSVENLSALENASHQFNTIYHQLLNNIPSDVALFDLSHRYVFLNKHCVKDDHTRNWLIGKDDFDYCRYKNKSFELAESRRSYFNEAFKTGKNVQFEETIVNQDGSIEYFLRTFTPIKNSFGIICSMLASGVNLTSIKLSEYKIQRAFKQYIDLFESIDLMIIAVDQNCLIQYVNNKWADFYDSSKEAFIGKDFLLYFQDDALSKSDYVNQMYSFSNSDKKLKRLIVSLKNQKGEIKKFRYYTKKIHSYLDGSDLDYIFLTNITLEMQVQEDLFQSNLTERQIHRHKSNFVSMVSHDLRTPLSIILSNAEILGMSLMQKQSLEKEETNLSIEKIITQVDHMQEMISNYLFLHKIETATFEPSYQETDIELCVKEIVNESYNPWKDGRKLSVILCGFAAKRKVDKTMLKTVLNNLLENAFKYSLLSNSSPILRVKGHAKFWTISVIDFGIGIPKDELDKIFTVFNRGTNVGNAPGTGVGLMIVKQLVDIRGASIMLRSVLNKYTILYIKIFNF